MTEAGASGRASVPRGTRRPAKPRPPGRTPLPRITVASRTRLAVMAVTFVLVAVAVGLLGFWGYAPLAGWDAAALVFVVWAWGVIALLGPGQTAAHATREDPGRAVSDLIVVVAAVASLAAVGYVLVQANSAKGAAQDGLAALGVASVAVSWLAVHTLYTLRYARLYYLGNPGGISFNQSTPPRYLDFAYLAFTLGMTYQVSDTDLQRPEIRATALRHALLSYLFGAVVLAATINLVVSLGSGSS